MRISRALPAEGAHKELLRTLTGVPSHSAPRCARTPASGIAHLCRKGVSIRGARHPLSAKPSTFSPHKGTHGVLPDLSLLGLRILLATHQDRP
jgi:hypothetical protein